MSKDKQNSVEIFHEEVWASFSNKLSWSELEELNNLKEKAQVMHKKEVLEFTKNVVRKILDEDIRNPFNIEQYYTKTFGNK